MQHYLGIDIGTSGTKTLICDEDGKVLATATAEHPISTPKPGWSNTNVLGILRGALGVKIAFDTDVNVAGLGESKWGISQGYDPSLYLTIGTGIGGGYIKDGLPLIGLLSPEMGHLRIPHNRERDPFLGNCPFHILWRSKMRFSLARHFGGWQGGEVPDKYIGAVDDEADALPLGSGAIAGTSYPVDTNRLAATLGFSRVVRNSMDASSDRDFVSSFLYAVATAMVHLSRLAEDLIVLDHISSGRAMVVLGLGYFCGLRRAEIANLKRSQVHLGQRRLYPFGELVHPSAEVRQMQSLAPPARDGELAVVGDAPVRSRICFHDGRCSNTYKSQNRFLLRYRRAGICHRCEDRQSFCVPFCAFCVLP